MKLIKPSAMGTFFVSVKLSYMKPSVSLPTCVLPLSSGAFGDNGIGKEGGIEGVGKWAMID